MVETVLQADTHGHLTIITGAPGSGKTTLCAQIMATAEQRNRHIAGFYSPAVIQQGQKTGITICLLPGNQCRCLGKKRNQITQEALTKHWQMNEATLTWANDYLLTLGETDLLIIDELGPLEFIGKRGLTAALPLLDSRRYRHAVAVIRPTLLSQAQDRWPWAQIKTLIAPEPAA